MKKAFNSDKDDLNICPCTRWTRADSLHDQRRRAAFKCLHLIGVPSETPGGIHPVPAGGFSPHPPLQESEPVPRSCRQACGQPHCCRLAQTLSHPHLSLQGPHFPASNSWFPLPCPVHLPQLSQKHPLPHAQAFTSRMSKRCHCLKTLA